MIRFTKVALVYNDPGGSPFENLELTARQLLEGLSLYDAAHHSAEHKQSSVAEHARPSPGGEGGQYCVQLAVSKPALSGRRVWLIQPEFS